MVIISISICCVLITELGLRHRKSTRGTLQSLKSLLHERLVSFSPEGLKKCISSLIIRNIRMHFKGQGSGDRWVKPIGQYKDTNKIKVLSGKTIQLESCRIVLQDKATDLTCSVEIVIIMFQ